MNLTSNSKPKEPEPGKLYILTVTKAMSNFPFSYKKGSPLVKLFNKNSVFMYVKPGYEPYYGSCRIWLGSDGKLYECKPYFMKELKF